MGRVTAPEPHDSPLSRRELNVRRREAMARALADLTGSPAPAMSSTDAPAPATRRSLRRTLTLPTRRSLRGERTPEPPPTRRALREARRETAEPPAEPQPSAPDPQSLSGQTDPAPTEPTPVETARAEPVPAGSEPAPAPAEPALDESTPAESAPAQRAPDDAAPAELAPVAPNDAAPAEFASDEPASDEPAPPEPAPASAGSPPTPQPVPAPRAPALSAPLTTPSPAERHARLRRALRVRVGFVTVAAAVLICGSAVAVTAAVTDPVVLDAGAQSSSARSIDRGDIAFGMESKLATEPTGATGEKNAAEIEAPSASVPPLADSLPVPSLATSPVVVDVCADPDVAAALAEGDDTAVIAAAGGAEAFRTAIAAGAAPCVRLDDPTRAWVVVDKAHPLVPIDFAPTPLTAPAGVRVPNGGTLRVDAAAALTRMVDAADAAGVGEIALGSGYRSHATQISTYNSQVSARGREHADLVSARPGYSEHQLGLTGDLIACNGGCGTIDDFAASPQGAWVAEHAWEYGWIVRYEEGYTPVTGYLPEPWHLRYIGTDLARAYHDGGWHTFEEFFGLEAAPEYVG